jgi:hypothetical protein
MIKKHWKTLALSVAGLVIIGILAYQIPYVNQRLVWRIDNWKAQIKYAFSPPEEEVFVPGGQEEEVSAIVEATLAALNPTQTPTPSVTPTPQEAETTPLPSLTATPSSTPYPTLGLLPGIQHEYQRWNNCGPANLSMSLTYWDWEGNQYVTAEYLKPNQRDRNVMPYEMVAFVNEETDLKALYRVGGDLELIKKFIAAGFPMLTETGFEDPREETEFTGWMGHYELLNAYDDGEGEFYAQDSFLGPKVASTYEAFNSRWRAFNYTYIIIYPPEKEEQVMDLLGPRADETYSYQQAAARASEEIYSLSGRDQFFAWFNRGSSLVGLDDYAGAAQAYDQAFQIYAELPKEERPWRMMWYQTGPYWAYYYTNRYYDVLNLATTTIQAMSEPTIEESWYWRALAKEALGDVSGAIYDLKKAVEINENFEIGWYHLNRLQGE